MKEATLCFLKDDDRVLLGMKKRGFGQGKWNGFGGKLEPGETPEESVVREIWEEIKVMVAPTSLVNHGTIHFSFGDKPEEEWFVHLFITTDWHGEPIETEEMRPTWYALDTIPYDEMWADDKYWLPPALAGKRLKARIEFDQTGDVVLNYLIEEL